MNKLIFALAFLSCTSLFAQERAQGVHQFKIENADFSPLQVLSPLSAQLSVDYDQGQIHLWIERAMPPCSKDSMCMQIMPPPLFVQLPITSITPGKCGVFHVMAERDFRPIQGKFQRIELIDASSLTCPDLIGYSSQALYETRSSQDGREVTAQSTLPLIPILNSPIQPEKLFFVKGSLLKGFPTYAIPSGGSLLIDSEKIKLEVLMQMDCKNRICPHMIPQPLYAELPILKIEKVTCGNKITARIDRRASDGSFEEIQIIDNQHSDCQFLVKPLVEVRYRALFQGSGQNLEHEASFSFDRISPNL